METAGLVMTLLTIVAATVGILSTMLAVTWRFGLILGKQAQVNDRHEEAIREVRSDQKELKLVLGENTEAIGRLDERSRASGSWPPQPGPAPPPLLQSSRDDEGAR